MAPAKRTVFPGLASTVRDIQTAMADLLMYTLLIYLTVLKAI
jgi:hypothetical protein